MVDEVSAVRQRETLVIQDKLNLLQSLLDNAEADRERLDRELRRAQQDQVAKDKVCRRNLLSCTHTTTCVVTTYTPLQRIKSEVRERLAAIKQAEALRTQLEELEAKQALLQEERAQALARAATAEANVTDPTPATPETATASAAVAVLAAGEALEQRLKVAYEKQYTKELAQLREQLKQAQELAAKAEAAAAAARTDAELRVVTTAEEAIETLEVEAEAELQLAKVAAVNACEAASAASLNAKTALEGQQEALKTAQAVRQEALAAEQRAQEARAEAESLTKEVEGLREKLEAAHKQAADAVREAAAVEAESLQRAAAAEAAAQARLDEALQALETLKAATEQRADEAHQRAEQYHGYANRWLQCGGHLVTATSFTVISYGWCVFSVVVVHTILSTSMFDCSVTGACRRCLSKWRACVRSWRLPRRRWRRRMPAASSSKRTWRSVWLHSRRRPTPRWRRNARCGLLLIDILCTVMCGT